MGSCEPLLMKHGSMSLSRVESWYQYHKDRIFTIKWPPPWAPSFIKSSNWPNFELYNLAESKVLSFFCHLAIFFLSILKIFVVFINILICYYCPNIGVSLNCWNFSLSPSLLAFVLLVSLYAVFSSMPSKRHALAAYALCTSSFLFPTINTLLGKQFLYNASMLLAFMSNASRYFLFSTRFQYLS